MAAAHLATFDEFPPEPGTARLHPGHVLEAVPRTPADQGNQSIRDEDDDRAVPAMMTLE